MCLANFCLTHPIEICSSKELIRVLAEQERAESRGKKNKHHNAVGAHHGETAVHEKHQVS